MALTSATAARIFLADGSSDVPKTRMRQQRDLGDDAEALDLFGGEQGDLRDLVGRRVRVDVGVGDEHRAGRQHHRVHGSVIPYAAAQTKHLVDVAQMLLVRAEHPAQHAVRLAAMNGQRADQRQPPAHLDLRVRLRDALALREAVVLGPVLLEAGRRARG
jgi:hypothetical protein